MYTARECEDFARLAQFADSEPLLSRELATSLRKAAGYHAENAFAASAKLQQVAA